MTNRKAVRRTAAPAPTPAVTEEAKTFYVLAQDTMINLYLRWQDEKGYENVADYLEPLRGHARAAGVTLTEMTKRPFGVRFAVGDRAFHAFVKGGAYYYKRTA